MDLFGENSVYKPLTISHKGQIILMFFRDGNVWSSHHSHLLDCDFFDQMENDSMTPWAKSENNPQQLRSPPESLRASSLNKIKIGKNNNSNNNKESQRKDNVRKRKNSTGMDAAVAKMTKRFKTRPLVLGNWRIGEGKSLSLTVCPRAIK